MPTYFEYLKLQEENDQLKQRIEQMKAVLRDILNSDMAMREEDEGHVSEELEAVRIVLGEKKDG
jgi:hypothetical protein